MSAVRTYKFNACPKCNDGTHGFRDTEGDFICATCYIKWEKMKVKLEPVTAIDERDVEPLLQTVERAVTKLRGPVDNREADAIANQLLRALVALQDSEVRL